MIKIREFDKILRSNAVSDVLQQATNLFSASINDPSQNKEYVQDLCHMGLSQPVLNAYYTEGANVIQEALAKKRKLDISMASDEYVIYTGLLNREFVIGYDVDNAMKTDIYTKSKALLMALHNAGAFENEAKYIKNMKALFGSDGTNFGNFGKKVITSFENNSLAMARLEVVGVVGDEVSFDLIIPSKFRDDYGQNFKLYPYSVFPCLAESLIKFSNSQNPRSFQEKGKKIEDVRALTVLQRKPDGNVKTRKMAFNADDVVKAYRRGTYTNVDQQEEAQILLKNQIKKTNCGWDCLKLYCKGFNLEASLYATPYTSIKFERLANFGPCSLKNIDTSMYMIDFDSVARLFRARMNSWRLADFETFNKIVDTSSCANMNERRQMVDKWIGNVDTRDLYKIMNMMPDLFKSSSGKSIQEGLDDIYNLKPRAAKHLEYVDLEADILKRKAQIKDMLNNGVCKICSASVRTGAPRVYYATNCPEVLKAAYGTNRLLAYESPKKAVAGVKELVNSGKIGSFHAFVEKLHKVEIDGIVDYSGLNDSSSPADWVNVLDNALDALDQKANDRAAKYQGSGTGFSYNVSFRRIDADSPSQFFGAVDVRNVESVEFGKQ